MSIPIYIPPTGADDSDGLSIEEVNEIVDNKLVGYVPVSGGSIIGTLNIVGTNETKLAVTHTVPAEDEEGEDVTTTIFGIGFDKGSGIVAMNGQVITDNNTLDNGMGDMEIGGGIQCASVTTGGLSVTGTMNLNDAQVNGLFGVSQNAEDDPIVSSFANYLGDYVLTLKTDHGVQTKNNTLDNASGNANFSNNVSVGGVLSVVTGINDVTVAELGCLEGVDSNIQDQLDAITLAQAGYLPLTGGTLSDDLTVNGTVTASEIIIDNGSNTVELNVDSTGYLTTNHSIVPSTINLNLGSSTDKWNNIVFSGAINTVSATELSYLDGVTSSIQSQIEALASGTPVDPEDLFLPLTGGTLTGDLTVDATITVQQTDESGATCILDIKNFAGGQMLGAYASGVVQTFKNELDDGDGNMTIAGNLDFTSACAINTGGDLNVLVDGEIIIGTTTAGLAGTGSTKIQTGLCDFTFALSDTSIYSLYPIIPDGLALPTLGTPDDIWFAVYANSFINVSDRNKKHNIIPSDLGLQFINDLKPCSYNIIGQNNGTSYGLIAQDVEESLQKLNKSSSDFSGLHKGKTYGLSYMEFISPMIKAIQELSRKNEEQDNEIKLLKKLLTDVINK